MSELPDKKIRETLLELVDKKEIKYTQNYIKRAKEETLERILKDYKREQLLETNEMLTDTVVGKFSEPMQYLELIDSSTELGKELIESKPFRHDVRLIIEYVTPYIPLIGVLSGGLIVENTL